MKRYRQSGFTLIEVTIVMAIAALLAVGVLFSQSQFRQRAAFTASVESLKNKLKQIQQETIASVNTSGAGNSGQRIFGTLVEFDASSGNASTVKVTQILGNDADLANGSPFLLALVLGSSSTFTLENGSTFSTTPPGGKQALIFTRSPDFIYLAPTPLPPSPGYNTNSSASDLLSVLNPNNYSRSNPSFNPGALDFPIISPNTNLTGKITVDSVNSTITRTVN